MAQGAGLEPAQDTINSRAHYLSATPEYWWVRGDLNATFAGKSRVHRHLCFGPELFLERTLAG